MYRIVRKEALKPTVILYEIEAPMVAKKAEPGQFIILRVDEKGERIPITIHDYDREKGTVTEEYYREVAKGLLELPAVLEMLAQRAVSDEAKERCRRLRPSTEPDAVSRLLDETDAAKVLSLIHI